MTIMEQNLGIQVLNVGINNKNYMIYTTKKSKERMKYLKKPNYKIERENIQMNDDMSFGVALLYGLLLSGACLVIIYGLLLI